MFETHGASYLFENLLYVLAGSLRIYRSSALIVALIADFQGHRIFLRTAFCFVLIVFQTKLSYLTLNRQDRFRFLVLEWRTKYTTVRKYFDVCCNTIERFIFLSSFPSYDQIADFYNDFIHSQEFSNFKNARNTRQYSKYNIFYNIQWTRQIYTQIPFV